MRCSLLACVALLVPLLASLRAFAAELADDDGKELKRTVPELVFSEDFSEPELDRSKWGVIVTGRTVNNEQQAYVDSKDVLYIAKGEEAEGAENGALVIKAVYKEGYTSAQGRKYDFISGRLEGRGKAEFAYGTMSARMKLPAGPGLWPAFWALGTGGWPATGEIDIMENVGEKEWLSQALHGRGYSGNTPLVNRYKFPDAKKDITDWHVYSVDWKREGFVFKVDGVTVYEVTREKVETYGVWAFDNPKFLILNLALGGDYPAGVNGERSGPYRGLPPATVQLIKDGKAKVRVDWVRVMKG
jgi:beta-glucanase (GH16 family)